MNNLSCKKITFLINSLGGGAEGVCVNLAHNFVERGWKVTIVTLHLNNAVLQNTLNKDVPLVVLGKKHVRTAGMALWRFLYQHQPDKILVFNHQLAVLLVLIRLLSTLKFKIISRNITTLSQKRKENKSLWHKYVMEWMIKIFYRKVDRVIAQSQGMAKDLISSYSIPRSKLSVIHNPISPHIEKMKIKRYSSQDYLLCAGRLEQVKAFHYAINAFATLAADYPHLRLKFLGQGSLEAELKEQAATLGVADRVDFEGYQPNVIPYYLGARATLLTSYYEGFPNVLLESIALGTPVVAFDCPSGPSEIVVNGVNGFLVSYQDESDLVFAIRKVLERLWPPDQVIQTATPFRSETILQMYENVLLN